MQTARRLPQRSSATLVVGDGDINQTGFFQLLFVPFHALNITKPPQNEMACLKKNACLKIISSVSTAKGANRRIFDVLHPACFRDLACAKAESQAKSLCWCKRICHRHSTICSNLR